MRRFESSRLSEPVQSRPPRLRRRSAEAQHDGRGGHPECHAERAVYQLREQPHEEEEQPGLVHGSPLQFVAGTDNDGRLGQPTKFEMVNQPQDRQGLGLTVPTELFLRADELIE